MCPQRQSMCGTTQNITPATESTTPTTVTVTGLTRGDSCTYRIKSLCGAPGFALKSESTGKDAKFAISFVEY